MNYTPTKLRRLLKQQGLTQKAAADLIGVSEAAVRKWATSAKSPHHREMPTPAWEMLLLKTGEHPEYLLARKITTAERRNK